MDEENKKTHPFSFTILFGTKGSIYLKLLTKLLKAVDYRSYRYPGFASYANFFYPQLS